MCSTSWGIEKVQIIAKKGYGCSLLKWAKEDEIELGHHPKKQSDKVWANNTTLVIYTKRKEKHNFISRNAHWSVIYNNKKRQEPEYLITYLLHNKILISHEYCFLKTF